MTSTLELTVNGDIRSLPGPQNVEDLLRHLSLDPGAVVVEVNGVIIRRPDQREVGLRTGDVVELVHFVGGG